MARPISERKRKLLEELTREFTADFRHEGSWRKNKRGWEAFYDGDQLTTEEKDTLRGRNQPEVVINRIKPKIDLLLGMLVTSRVRSKAAAREPQDFETAQVVSEAFRFIEYNTDFDDEEMFVFKDAAVSGRGFFKVELDFDDEDNPEIKTVYADNNDVVIDRHSRKKDMRDAKRVHESIWMNLEDAIAMFPRFETELTEAVDRDVRDFNTMSGGAFDRIIQERPDQYQQGGDDDPLGLFRDEKAKRVRVTSTWRKEFKIRNFLVDAAFGAIDLSLLNGEQKKQLLEQFPNAKRAQKKESEVKVITWVANAVLEEKDSPRMDGKFPFVMVEAYREKTKNLPYGIVKQMVSPQEEINKRRSKMLHMINVRQALMEDGAQGNLSERQIKERIAQPDGLIKIQPGFRFDMIDSLQASQAQFQLLQEAKSEIDESGINKEIEGQGGTSQSGKAIQLRAQQSATIVRPLFDSLRKAKKQLAAMWISDIQQYWTNEKIIRVLNDKEAPQFLALNSPIIDPQTGEVVGIKNNASMAKFDIIVEEVPDTLNLQAEQFEQLVRLAQAGMPIPPEMIISASTLPNKQELLAQMQAQQQAQQEAMQAAAIAKGQAVIPIAGNANISDEEAALDAIAGAVAAQSQGQVQ